MEDVVVVMTTVPDETTGERLAGVLVEERLAACVNLVPGIRSCYRWEGAVQHDSEVLLLAKVRADRLAGYIARMKGLHPYEVPEILALPVRGGFAPYLEWVCREGAPDQES